MRSFTGSWATAIFAGSLLLGARSAGGIELLTMQAPCDLVSLNPDTGSIRIIGSIGAGIEDFATSPEGAVFASASSACAVHGAAGNLVTIDLDTAELQHVGQIGFADVDAIAYDIDGTLFGVDAAADVLIVIDPETGNGTEVGPVGFQFIGGLDFSPDGVLFATDIGGPNGGPSTLLTIDTSTGKGTAVGQIGFRTVEGLAFAPDGTLFGISDLLGGGTGELIRIDRDSGLGEAVMQVNRTGKMDGLMLVPSDGGGDDQR